MASELVTRCVAVVHEMDLVRDGVGRITRAVLRLINRATATSILFSFLAVGPATADPSSPIFIGAGAAVAFIAGEVLQKSQPDRNRAYATLGGGYFDVYRREDTAGYFRLEYKPPWQVWRFKPMVGMFTTSDGAVAAYLGMGYDLHIGEHSVINVNIAPAFYYSGRGKYLGSYAVLRSGFELGYRFGDGTRLMASFHHMSHGKVFSHVNSGTDTAAVSVHIPVELLERWLKR
jgi:hypothetical protein